MTVRELIDQLTEISRYKGDHCKVIVSDWEGREGDSLSVTPQGGDVVIDVYRLTIENEDTA